MQQKSLLRKVFLLALIEVQDLESDQQLEQKTNDE